MAERTQFDPETVAFVEAGSALIVGLARPSGDPLACRAWALTHQPGSCRFRLLLDADDLAHLPADLSGAPIAVTATDVPTLTSLQLKGRVVTVEQAADGDHARLAEYCEAFYGDVHRTEGTPLAVLERMTPAGILPVIIEVDEMFDQTPGPAAGGRRSGTP